MLGITHRAFLQEIDEDSPLWPFRNQKLIDIADKLRREAAIPKDYIFEDDEDDIAYREEQKNKVPEPRVNLESEPLIIEEKKINNKADLDHEKKLTGFFALKNCLLIANAYLKKEKNIDQKLESELLSNFIFKKWKYYMPKYDFNYDYHPFYNHKTVLDSIWHNEKENDEPLIEKVCMVEGQNISNIEYDDLFNNITCLPRQAYAVFLIYIDDYFVGCIANKEPGYRTKFTLVSHKEIDKKAKDIIMCFINDLESFVPKTSFNLD